MKKTLLQRLTDHMFKLNKRAKRDPQTKEEFLVRVKLNRIENIIRKRYGDIYYLTVKNVGSIVVDKDGEDYDMYELQREWISKAKLGRRTKH